MAGVAGRVIGVAALAAAMAVAALAAAMAVGSALFTRSHEVRELAACPVDERPNPAGYGCVPNLAPGGNWVGAPTQQALSACHGNLYYCVDPYAGSARP